MGTRKPKQSAAASASQASSQSSQPLRRSTRNRTPSVEPEAPSRPAPTPTRTTRKTSAEKASQEETPSSQDTAKPKSKRGRKKKAAAPIPEPILEEHEPEQSPESESLQQPHDNDIDARSHDGSDHGTVSHSVADEPEEGDDEPHTVVEVDQDDIIIDETPAPHPEPELEVEMEAELHAEPEPEPDQEESAVDDVLAAEHDVPELEADLGSDPEQEAEQIVVDDADSEDEDAQDTDSRKSFQEYSTPPPFPPDSINLYSPPAPPVYAGPEDSDARQELVTAASVAALRDWRAVAEDDAVVPPGVSLDHYLSSVCSTLTADHVADLLVEQFKEIKKLKSDGHGLLDRAKKAADDLEASRFANTQLAKSAAQERQRTSVYQKRFDDTNRALHESNLAITSEKRKRKDTEDESQNLKSKLRKLSNTHTDYLNTAHAVKDQRVAAFIHNGDIVITGANSEPEAARLRDLLLRGLPKDHTPQQWHAYNHLLSTIAAWDHYKINEIRAKMNGRAPIGYSSSSSSSSSSSRRAPNRARPSSNAGDDGIIDAADTSPKRVDLFGDRHAMSGGRDGLPATPPRATTLDSQDSSWTGSLRSAWGSVSKLWALGRGDSAPVAPRTEPVPRTRQFKTPAREAAEASAAAASINSHPLVPDGVDSFERAAPRRAMRFTKKTYTDGASEKREAEKRGPEKRDPEKRRSVRDRRAAWGLTPRPSDDRTSLGPDTATNPVTSDGQVATEAATSQAATNPSSQATTNPPPMAALGSVGSQTDEDGNSHRLVKKTAYPLHGHALEMHKFKLQLGIQDAYHLSKEQRWTNKVGEKHPRMVTVRVKNLMKPDHLGQPPEGKGFGLDAAFFEGDSDESDEEVEVSADFAERYLKKPNKRQKTGQQQPAHSKRADEDDYEYTFGSPPASRMTYFVPDFSSDSESDEDVPKSGPLVSEKERKIMEAWPHHVGAWPDAPNDDEEARRCKKQIREDTFRINNDFTLKSWEDLKRRWAKFNQAQEVASAPSPPADALGVVSGGKTQDNIFNKSAGPASPQPAEPSTPAKSAPKPPAAQTPGDDTPLARARLQAEKYKPKTPSGLREASRIASSPAQSAGTPDGGSPDRNALAASRGPAAKDPGAPLTVADLGEAAGLVNDGTLEFAKRLAYAMPEEFLPETHLPIPGTIQIYDGDVLRADDMFMESGLAKELDEHYTAILTNAMRQAERDREL